MFNAYRDSFNKHASVNPFGIAKINLSANQFKIRTTKDLTDKFMISTIKVRFFYSRLSSLDSDLEVATNREEYTRTVAIDSNYCGSKLQKLRES